jgi:glycosyltransferase involved in cell wall biosynthesis
VPNVLFVHNGSPGRFASLAVALKARGWNGALINGPTGRNLPGFPTVSWRTDESVARSQHAVARDTETSLVSGRAAAAAARRLKEEGFVPDLIIGHPAWGEMLFLDEIFPNAPQIQIGELYYRTHDSDVDFDPGLGIPYDPLRTLARNLTLATSYANAARIVAPTPYQASTIPKAFHQQIRIIHEGIDLDATVRRKDARISFQSGLTLDGSTPVVTFINRCFEPMRGFHIFMRALPRLLELVPEVHVILVGGDRNGGYGPTLPGKTWREALMEEVGPRLDMERVHFTGLLGYEDMLRVLSLSWAHVYMTYPFVLSWSLLDAMACECLLVASDTAPVRDVIVDGVNGILFDFFDHDGLADRLADACRNPAAYAPLRQAARQTVADQYDRRNNCEPAWLALVDEVMAERGRPPCRSGEHRSL